MSTRETVDTMRLDGTGISGQLRVMRVLRNGKRRFDPAEKERLIDAALEPGVSVAGLALEHGVNTNQLRNWITLRRRRQEAGGRECVDGCAERRGVSLYSGGRNSADRATAGDDGSADIASGAREGVAAERGSA